MISQIPREVSLLWKDRNSAGGRGGLDTIMSASTSWLVTCTNVHSSGQGCRASARSVFMAPFAVAEHTGRVYSWHEHKVTEKAFWGTFLHVKPLFGKVATSFFLSFFNFSLLLGGKCNLSYKGREIICRRQEGMVWLEKGFACNCRHTQIENPNLQDGACTRGLDYCGPLACIPPRNQKSASSLLDHESFELCPHPAFLAPAASLWPSPVCLFSCCCSACFPSILTNPGRRWLVVVLLPPVASLPVSSVPSELYATRGVFLSPSKAVYPLPLCMSRI